MKQYLELQFLFSQAALLWSTFSRIIFRMDTGMACIAIALSLLLALLVSRPLVSIFEKIRGRIKKRNPFQEKILDLFPRLIKFIIAVFFLSLCSEILEIKKFDPFFVDICSRLLTAWVLIACGTGVLQNHNWAKILSSVIWSVAALHILGWLLPLIQILDRLSINIGDVHLSILLVCKAVLLFGLMLKGVGGVASFTEKRLHSLPDISPSIQVLLSKMVKISLFVLAVIIALGILGIDLSAFAFIGGAIGVGLGFGLQKVVSNLVSGIILLLDRSIKPGDVIEIGSTYGRIQSLGARYVSVATRDNTEYLIPNEDLIANQVVNWSFSNARIRLKILFPVSYDSDIHQVMDLILTAAASVPRVLKYPKPSCQLKEFGDSSLDLELRLWIEDPGNGISSVKSAVRIAVWDVFKEKGIEVPFPQMDIHMRNSNM